MAGKYVKTRWEWRRDKRRFLTSILTHSLEMYCVHKASSRHKNSLDKVPYGWFYVIQGDVKHNRLAPQNIGTKNLCARLV